MSNIEQNLQKILTSRYGKDVRQAIHDGIHDCYEDGKSGAVDLVAREQIANLVANNNPTDGNSELIDIRVGTDGTTYESAGKAVRTQLQKTKNASDITKRGLEEYMYNMYDASNIIPNTFIDQQVGISKIDKLNTVEGQFTSGQIWSIKKGDIIYANVGYATFGIYNNERVLIKIINDEQTEHIIDDEDACFLRMSSLNSDTYTDRFMFNINRPLPDSYVKYGEVYNLARKNECRIEELESYCAILSSFNKLDPDSIIEGARYNDAIGSKDTDFVYNDAFIYSKQKIYCKKNDVIRVSQNYAYITIYDIFGHVIEIWNDDKYSYTVKNKNAVYLRYSCISNSDTYKRYFMITINENIPKSYVPYGISTYEYNTEYVYKKPLLMFTFDDDISEGDESNTVKLMIKKYGYRFAFNGCAEYAKTLLKEGCDLATYSNISDELPPESTIDSADEEDINAWNEYVKKAKEKQENAGYYNPTLWEAWQLKYGVALEKALINNGYKFCRASSSSIPVQLLKNTQYQKIPTIVPTDVNLETVQSAIKKLVYSGGVLCILFHKVLNIVPENDTWDISVSYFTDILDYIKTYVDDGQIKIVTPRELYRLYNPNDGYEHDYNRIMKIIHS